MPDCFHLAIASGKGGTGKTLVATNLFYSITKAGTKATLVDCDAEVPNAKLFFAATRESTAVVNQKVPVIDESLCIYCGKCREWCAYHAIFFLQQPPLIKVLEELCHGCGACLEACPSGAISEKEIALGVVTQYFLSDGNILIEACMVPGVYSPVPLIEKGIHDAMGHGMVIMDAPPGTACPFIHTIAAADYVVLVTEPTPFGLSDLKQSVEIIRDIKKPFGVIVNRTGMGDRWLYNYLEEEHIPLLMEIPFQRSIASCYAKGKLMAAEEGDWEQRFLGLAERIGILWR
jgi:MinD superfamily P-loop ATPase